jgi:TatD DNase family protein
MDQLPTYPNVWITIGIHPKEAPQATPDVESALEWNLIHRPKVVAIGECGLDFHHGRTSMAVQRQREVLLHQVKLAHKYKWPIVIHCREAYHETFQIVQDVLSPNHQIHLHCFSGTGVELMEWTDHFESLKVGFTGRITWDKGKVSDISSVVKDVALDRIVLETDAPHFPPANLDPNAPDLTPRAEQYSHPGHALNVAKRIAELKGVGLKEVLRVTTQNCKDVYNL